MKRLRYMFVVNYAHPHNKCKVCFEGADHMKRYRLTKDRINKGLLSPGLEQKYKDVQRSQALVEEFKAQYPDTYVEILREQIGKISTPIVTPSEMNQP